MTSTRTIHTTESRSIIYGIHPIVQFNAFILSQFSDLKIIWGLPHSYALEFNAREYANTTF